MIDTAYTVACSAIFVLAYMEIGCCWRDRAYVASGFFTVSAMADGVAAGYWATKSRDCAFGFLFGFAVGHLLHHFLERDVKCKLKDK